MFVLTLMWLQVCNYQFLFLFLTNSITNIMDSQTGLSRSWGTPSDWRFELNDSHMLPVTFANQLSRERSRLMRGTASWKKKPALPASKRGQKCENDKFFVNNSSMVQFNNHFKRTKVFIKDTRFWLYEISKTSPSFNHPNKALECGSRQSSLKAFELSTALESFQVRWKREPIGEIG